MAIKDAAEPEGTLTAPGSSACSCSVWRPFNGSSRTRPASTTSLTVELNVSTEVTLACTATTSRTSPTCIARSTRPRWLTSTKTLPASALRNPGASQETLQVGNDVVPGFIGNDLRGDSGRRCGCSHGDVWNRSAAGIGSGAEDDAGRCLGERTGTQCKQQDTNRTKTSHSGHLSNYSMPVLG